MSLSRIVLLIVVVVVIGVSYVWMKLPKIVANELSKKAQVEVSIADINLSIDEISLDQIVFGNPKGSHLAKAFSAGKVTVSAPLTNYVKNAIVIDELRIDAIYFGLEFGSLSNPTGNWVYILSNLGKNGQASTSKTGGRTILIKRLILTNITAELVERLTGTRVQKLSPITQLQFTDVSSEGGIGQLARVVLDLALQELIKRENLQTPQGVFDKFKTFMPQSVGVDRST